MTTKRSMSIGTKFLLIAAASLLPLALTLALLLLEIDQRVVQVDRERQGLQVHTALKRVLLRGRAPRRVGAVADGQRGRLARAAKLGTEVQRLGEASRLSTGLTRPGAASGLSDTAVVGTSCGAASRTARPRRPGSSITSCSR